MEHWISNPKRKVNFENFELKYHRSQKCCGPGNSTAGHPWGKAQEAVVGREPACERMVQYMWVHWERPGIQRGHRFCKRRPGAGQVLGSSSLSLQGAL